MGLFMKSNFVTLFLLISSGLLFAPVASSRNDRELDKAIARNSILARDLSSAQTELNVLRAKVGGCSFSYQESSSFDESRPEGLKEQVDWESRRLKHQITRAKAEIAWLRVISLDAARGYDS